MKNRNTEKNKIKEMDMLNGPLLVKLIVFALPVIFSGILQLLFNAADTIVVGRFAGSEALAAVGSTSSLINLLTNVFIGLSVGANVCVAHFYGSGEKNKISNAVHSSVLLALIGGVVAAIIGITLSKPLLTLMGTPNDVLTLATLYIRIYFAGMPGILLYNFGAAILRAAGDTSRPLRYLLGSGVVNVILNLILVIPLKMSVAGVGIATIVSQYISAALVLRALALDDGPLHFSFAKLHFDKQIVKRIMAVGLPAGIQGSVFSFSNVIIQSSVNSFGSVVMAGNAAASSIESFVYIAMNSIYQTSISFTGQNYGAGKKKRVLKILLLCLAIVSVVGLLMGNIMTYFGVPLLSIYTGNPDAIAAGLLRMKYIMAPYLLCGVMDVTVGSLRGMGRSILPTIVSVFCACILRIILIFTYFQAHHELWIIYALYPLTWGLCFLVQTTIFIFTYRRMKEKKS